MKEGYLQLKISELNDKCAKIDKLISMEKSKIELLEERVGGLKELIKKLQDLDEFKNNILKEIKDDNNKLISEEIKSISDKATKNTDILMKNKIKEIENIFNYFKKSEKEINFQKETFVQINEKINYLLKHNELLMMKLVNKALITDREVTELHTRSSKKSD